MPERIVLIGGRGKRLEYFQKAAEAEGWNFIACEYESYEELKRVGDAVKLDPPAFNATNYAALHPFIDCYLKNLLHLAAWDDIAYLNHPLGIMAALDKKETRRRLETAGVAIAPALEGTPRNQEELLKAMRAQNMHRVFIKPRYGSGAAGIIAISALPTGRQALYTTLREQDGILYNTKSIQRGHDRAQQERLLNAMLAEDVIIERWVPKASVDGIAYDLRVVWQLGRVVFIVARGSRGPITNLHINDMAMDLERIPLPPSLMADVSNLCDDAMACFPDLCYAGLDILLPHGGGAPLVIEVNAQGDLIYKDIFAENAIYSEQVRYLAAQEEACI